MEQAGGTAPHGQAEWAAQSVPQTYSDAAYSDPAAKLIDRSVIDAQLDRGMSELEQLHATIETLHTRLRPVCSPQLAAPEASLGENPAPSSDSPIANRIRTANDGIRLATGALQQIIAELDL